MTSGNNCIAENFGKWLHCTDLMLTQCLSLVENAFETMCILTFIVLPYIDIHCKYIALNTISQLLFFKFQSELD